MNIAVIGSGIAGLAATWYLSKHHPVTLFERGAGIGLDANSLELDSPQGPVPVNAPMRVFFEAYYPNLSALYQAVGARYQPIKYSGSFSHRDERAYFHYENHWLGGRTVPWLAGRSFWSPGAWRLGLDLLQLIRQVQTMDIGSLPAAMSIETFLSRHGYKSLGNAFLYPAFAGICTCSYEQLKAYPAAVILDYLGRDLTWARVNRLSEGAGHVARRLASAAAQVHCNRALTTVRPDNEGVEICDEAGHRATFDHVVIATQADQAHALLPETMQAERQALARFRYQRSRLVVHRDRRLLPADARDWAPVNFVLSPEAEMPMASIWLNRVYPELAQQNPVIETWNPHNDLDPAQLLIETTVTRPVVTTDSLGALEELETLQTSASRRVWFCGSYAGPGIPLLESAVCSAKRISEQLIATSCAQPQRNI